MVLRRQQERVRLVYLCLALRLEALAPVWSTRERDSVAPRGALLVYFQPPQASFLLWVVLAQVTRGAQAAPSAALVPEPVHVGPEAVRASPERSVARAAPALACFGSKQSSSLCRIPTIDPDESSKANTPHSPSARFPARCWWRPAVAAASPRMPLDPRSPFHLDLRFFPLPDQRANRSDLDSPRASAAPRPSSTEIRCTCPADPEPRQPRACPRCSRFAGCC